jgi:hypothetical protein
MKRPLDEAKKRATAPRIAATANAIVSVLATESWRWRSLLVLAAAVLRLRPTIIPN